MSWPEHMDPALREYIEERQARALQVYEADHDLLIEHVRQEDSFRMGGYGTRQIPEILQNAVDALAAGGQPGRIEFRLAGGALYCANEGAPFDHGGVRAVTYAFLSGKRNDEIGRFGLGFKSILGITQNPQVYSRSVSFEFNADGTRELFDGIPTDGGRLPLLRVPSLADPQQAAADDPHLEELMDWATTVIKLPLERDGRRIHEELTKGFDAEALLFLQAIDELTVTTLNADKEPVKRVFRRVADDDAGTVTISGPGEEPVLWLFAQREYEPSEDVAASLPETMRRKRMTVSYAINPQKRRETGELWSWFPLRDQTTAGGRFNAPWQINDDRTTLVDHSKLNGALLEMSAELFLDVAIRASSPNDPAAHLDMFPGRGKELRSRADGYLSEAIPRLAAERAIIPDRSGALRPRSYFRGIPNLEQVTLTSTAVNQWNEHIGRDTVPHEKCFTTDTRRKRLRSLLGSRGADMPSLAAWIEAPIKVDFEEGTRAALRIAAELAGDRTIRDEVLRARIIPLQDGGLAPLGSSRNVLLPSPDRYSPQGIDLVASDFCAGEGNYDLLRGFGFQEVSADEVVRAIAARLTSRSTDDDWATFWRAAAHASTTGIVRAFEEASSRIARVRTRDGQWRSAEQVFADDSFAPDLEGRHVHPEIAVARQALLAAGCLDGPRSDVKAGEEPFFADWANAVHAVAAKAVRAKGGTVRRTELTDFLSTMEGAGPVALFREELAADEVLAWTTRLLRSMPRRDVVVTVPVDGVGGGVDITIPSLEWWTIERYGLVQTTLGAEPVQSVVGIALMNLSWLLPVVMDGALSGIVNVPRSLDAVPDPILENFLRRDDYPVVSSAAITDLLVECASRPAFATMARLPAVRGGRVVLAPLTEIVLTEDESEVEEAEDAGIPHLPALGAHAVFGERWGLERARQVFSREVEPTGVDPELLVTDVYPSLPAHVAMNVRNLRLVRADSLVQVRRTPKGAKRQTVRSALRDERTVLVDRELDEADTLSAVSKEANLGLTMTDVAAIIREDEQRRRSDRIDRARVAASHAERLLILVGRDAMESVLPSGLLQAIEAKRGRLDDADFGELYMRTFGNDAVFEVRKALQSEGVPVPRTWDGTANAQAAVKHLGFSTAFAGVKEVRPPNVTLVPGIVDLSPLHDYQQDLADQIHNLVVERRDGQYSRALMYLPTGAGKTRVTVEAILRMMKDGTVTSPVLWIAQSAELCEQAIQSFTEVWRWLGDERPLDISRFWGGYVLDESAQELQVVVAIDDTLDSRLGEPEYEWLGEAGLVVIDEAHTAGDSPTYTRILGHLGLTARSTARPLLGLTATPFKGRNQEVNNRFAGRFGDRQLRSERLGDDPMAELRRRRVLSQVDYDVLKGARVASGAISQTFRDVSKEALNVIGQDVQRTQTVVDDIVKRIRENAPDDYPVLVFAASVASAHTVAALLELQDVRAAAVDGSMRMSERRRIVGKFKSGEIQVLVNCDLFAQGFDAPKVRALYIARPTFSPNRYLQMVGRGLRGPINGGTERCLVVNVEDTFEAFGEQLAYNEFDYLWSKG